MGLSYSNKNTNTQQTFAKTTTDPIKKDKSFFCALGDSFMLKNEFRKAIKEYLVSLMIDKDNIRARLGASKAYKGLKEYDKAIKHLKDARSLFGFDSEIYYELGLNYLLNADNINAQKNFIRTIKLQPDNKNAQIKLALTHELAGEEEMAILVYQTVIEKYPDYIPALSSLAALYIEKEEFLDAVVLYKKILKINEEYHRAYLGLGLCFDRMGKFVYATRYYKKYIALKPKSQTARALIGRIYEYHHKKDRKNENVVNNKLRIIKK